MRASGNRCRSARTAGVVKMTTPIWRRRTRRIRENWRAGSLFNFCFVDEHDRDVVLDRIDAFAGRTLERGSVLDERHRRLAIRAGENLEQFGIDGHGPTI